LYCVNIHADLQLWECFTMCLHVFDVICISLCECVYMYVIYASVLVSAVLAAC